MPEEQNIPQENSKEQIPDFNEEAANENIPQEQAIEQTETEIETSGLPTGQAGITTSDIQNMEVHHHPDLHHRKKHWKEYFLEFLMIFLAVTLGFFAENFRESITDSHRGKEYIKSLAQDLRADTASLNGHIHAWSGQIDRTDSLINLIKHNIGHLDEHEFYRQISLNMGYNPFNYHSKTIDQLKSSGSFRLIDPQSLSENIMDYDNLIRNDLLGVQKKMSDAVEQQTAFLYHLIDYTVFPAFDSLSSSVDNHFKNLPDKLLVNADDKIMLNEFLGLLWNKRQLIVTEIFLAENAKENAVNLLKQINKEYHLENE